MSSAVQRGCDKHGRYDCECEPFMTKKYFCAVHGLWDTSHAGDDCPACSTRMVTVTQSTTPAPKDQPDPYSALKQVLDLALKQANAGKGIERHGHSGVNFEDQQIVKFGQIHKSPVYNIGQADKKINEALHLQPKPAIREILGAINYLAGAVIIIAGLNGLDLSKEGF